MPRHIWPLVVTVAIVSSMLTYVGLATIRKSSIWGPVVASAMPPCRTLIKSAPETPPWEVWEKLQK